MNAAEDAFPSFDAGAVWLVGAGPGDPLLLTRLAHHALQQADAIVYDALVDPGVLRLARSGAVLEYAGKRGGKPSPKQRDISLRLIDLARKGKRVLRLKGGDPLVFGRGGEEALALAAAGVPFRIVPGVSSGIGGLASAGIPVTHRDINQAVTFVTGHTVDGHTVDGGAPRGLDWAAIARGAPVIVLYMALSHLPEIAARLIAGGRDAAEPVAIVTDATTTAERVLETTLAGCAAGAAAVVRPPAIIVIGGVVALRAALDWRTGSIESRRAAALGDVARQLCASCP